MRKENFRLFVYSWGIFLLVSCLLSPVSVFAAALSVSPASGTFTVGQSVVVSVLVSSDVPMNAVSGVLSFPTDILSVEYVKKGSVLNFWVAEPSYSNSLGRINFEGVSLSGFQGTTGSVLTVGLRAKKAGQGTVAFESGQVLAHDGQGTDITAGLRSGTYIFEPGKTQTPAPRAEPEVVEPVQEEPAAQVLLEAPTIRFGLQDGNDAVQGDSKYPDADVVLAFIAVSGSKVYITGTADSNGSFTLLVPASLKNGAYAVTATMILDDGRQSETSEPLTLEVGAIGGFLTWEYAAYAVFALLLLSVATIGYLLRFGYFGLSTSSLGTLKKEVGEVEDVVRRSFASLREKASRPSHTGPQLPGEQTEILAAQKDLADAERAIEKEIRDIDSLSSGKGK